MPDNGLDSQVPQQMAMRFHLSTGLEFEDLYQEARLAYWQALHDPAYDPRKSALSTYATTCVYHHMCTLTRSLTRQKTPPSMLLPLSNRLVDPRCNPEQASIFMSLLRDLPNDARIIVDMIRSHTSQMAAMTHWEALRDLRIALIRRGWSTRRIYAAFMTIRTFLRSSQCI